MPTSTHGILNYFSPDPRPRPRPNTMAPARRTTNLEVDTSKTTAEEPRRSARLALTPRSARANEPAVSPTTSRKRSRIAEHTGDADEAMMDAVPEAEEVGKGGRARKGKARAEEAEAHDSGLASDDDGDLEGHDDGTVPEAPTERDTRKKAATKSTKGRPKVTPRKSSGRTGTATNKGKGEAEETPWWEQLPPTPEPDERGDDGKPHETMAVCARSTDH